MIVIGLTGGIGMGKSTTARMFADHDIPVWDADAAVHQIYAAGGQGAARIAEAFPDTLATDGSVDRLRLAAALGDDPANWHRLDALIHPLVMSDRAAFLDTARDSGAWAVLCDIPLLFEAGLDRSVDVVVLCSAAENVRTVRVLARPGMTEEKLAAITARQLPDNEKRARADYIVETDQGLAHAATQVVAIVDALKRRQEAD